MISPNRIKPWLIPIQITHFQISKASALGWQELFSPQLSSCLETWPHPISNSSLTGKTTRLYKPYLC